tara:strand:+ start:197 stop:478 length:282 start_codon:yes stop_codon:yes gene_type:complete
MIKWSHLPISDLNIAAVISLETAGFIGNKYSPLYGFVYMFSIIFVIIFMMSLDAVKTKSKLEKIEPKNNVIPVQIQPKYEKKIESRQWFWQSA